MADSGRVLGDGRYAGPPMNDESYAERIRFVKFWRHKKTNNIYRVLGISTCSTNGMNGMLTVVYVNAEDEMYNRDVDEFFDGRFEPMNSIAIMSLKG